MSTNKIKLCAIVGPTATGKTRLAIELAKKYNAEIISADSMQIYKGMDILTAKPTSFEMSSIPHYLLSFLSVEEAFSVAQYVKIAHNQIYVTNRSGKLPLIVGGTGLYINSVVDDISFSEYEQDCTFRDELRKKIDEEGCQALYDELLTIDSESAQRIDKNDAKRIIRAIEIYKTSGKTMSEQLKNSRLRESRYDVLIIGLNFKDREKLYDKINTRVEKMLKDGLIDEVKNLSKLKLSKTAREAIGYKEILPYIQNKCSLEEAIQKLKQNSRKYAKRQLTWFKKDKRVNWLYLDEVDSWNQLMLQAEKLIRDFIFS